MLSFLGILIFTSILLNIPFVQSRITDVLITKINENYNTDIRVEEVSIRTDGSILLKSFFIADHHADTLFFAKNFQTDFYSFGQWLDGNLFFETAEFDEAFLKVTQYEGELQNSFFHFSGKLFSNLSHRKRNPVFIRLNELNLKRSKILFNNISNQKQDIKIEEINILGNDFFVVNDQVQIELNQFSFKSDDFGKLSSLKTKININPCEIELLSFNLEAEGSILNGGLEIETQNSSLGFFHNNSKINLKLEKGYLTKGLLNKFVSVPDSFESLHLSFKASGLLSDLKITDLIAKNNYLDFASNVTLKKDFLTNLYDVNTNILRFQFSPKNLNNFLTKSIFKKIPEKFFKYDQIQIKGQANYQNKALTTNLNFTIDDGKVFQKGVLSFRDNKPFRFKGNFVFEKLNLKPWGDKLGALDASLFISANNLLSEGINFNYNLMVSELFIGHTPITKLTFKGGYIFKTFTSEIEIDDNLISAKSAISFSWSNFLKKYQFDLNLNNLNLHLLDKKLGYGKAVFSGDLTVYLVGNSFDKIQGNLLFKNLNFENANESFKYNDFIIETKLLNGFRSLKTINSDLINFDLEGKFLLSEFPYLFQNAISEVYSFIPKKKVKPGQSLSYDLSFTSGDLNAVFPNLSLCDSLLFRGLVSADEKVSKLAIRIPKISYKGISFQNIYFQLDNQNPFFNTYISVGNIISSSFRFKDFNTISKNSKGNVLFRTEFIVGDNDDNKFELNYVYSQKKMGPVFELKKSIASINGNQWLINPMDKSDHSFSFNRLSNKFDLNSFEAVSKNQKVSLSMSYLNADDFNFELIAENVLIDRLDIPSKNFQMGGTLDLDIGFTRSFFKNSLNIDGNILGFNLNKLSMGNLSFFTEGNTEYNSYDINLLLLDGVKKTLIGKGNIFGFGEKPSLDIDFNFNDFNISFLNPLGKGDVNNIRGKVSGDVNLSGSINSLSHQGKLTLNDGGLAIKRVNTDYEIRTGAVVKLKNQTFNFQPTTFKDIKFGTQAQLSGKIDHNNFKNWRFDFNILSDRILMLNIDEADDPVFFGDGFFGGEINLFGPSKNLIIDVVGSTMEGTHIKIPWSKDYGLIDTSFIKYIDKKNINFSKNNSSKIEEPIRGVEMNFELDINTNTEIELVIDEDTGSTLRGRGAGNILMEIDTNGKFNMWGDFITFDGIYNFKNLGLIDKKFNLKQGGTIVWEGDPFSAQMDLEALYVVPGGANPALLLDNPNFNRKIPTEVLIRLQGNLLKPDDPVFEINFPNTNAVVASEINYRLADPQTSQLQAISLLSQGIFINEVSLSVEGITNNLYEKASDIFSNIMGNDQGKLQVGLNYLQGDRSRILNSDSEDRLGLTVSTQLTDKILINGKIGVPVGGLEETLIVGDLQIDFILNEEGSLKAKVFNKENEFRYIGDELGYTQGLGLSYKVDFDTFKDLIFKIVNRSDLDSFITNRTELDDSNDSGLNFINKN